MRSRGGLASLLLALVVFSISNASADVTDAFPGAVGYGKNAQGGRLGSMIFVTSLADSGPGTLRSCIESTGPRNCIFRVAGIIRLATPLGVLEKNGNLSILGQTAPDPGITLTIDPQTPSHIKTPLFVRNTQDVIIRHLRIRLQYPASVPNADTMTVENSKRVYVDHISGSWATDEGFSTHADATDVTVANSIFAEGLLPHSKCVLLGSDPTTPQRITFWQNACLSNNDRNPDVNHFGGSCIEILNNVFYNARSEWVEVFSQFPGGTPVSIVGNYFKAGKATAQETHAVVWQPEGAKSRPTIYLKDNVTWAPDKKTISLLAPETIEVASLEPSCTLTMPVVPANEAYQTVRSQSGAFPRDNIDTDLMQALGDKERAGSGTIPKHPGSLSTQPVSATAYADVDLDGMADSVEEQFGAQPGLYDPWSKSPDSKWRSFDMFAEWLSQHRVSGHTPP